MKNSGEPIISTRGRTMGMAAASASAPKMAPTSELMSDAPRARPASPFFAMGCPSTIVDAVIASPGIPNRMDVMSPVVAVTADIPRRNANASTACILKINGSISARVTGPPRPGRMPTANPITMPSIISVKVVYVNTCASPAPKASSISGIILRSR